MFARLFICFNITQRNESNSGLLNHKWCVNRKAFKTVKIPPGPYCLDQMSHSEIRFSLGKTVDAKTVLYLILTKHHHFQHYGVNWSIYTTFSTFMINLRISKEILHPDIIQTPFMGRLELLFHGWEKLSESTQ